jgi:hypothetical protein
VSSRPSNLSIFKILLSYTSFSGALFVLPIVLGEVAASLRGAVEIPIGVKDQARNGNASVPQATSTAPPRVAAFPTTELYLNWIRPAS